MPLLSQELLTFEDSEINKPSDHFDSVAQLCLILYNPMDCSMPGLPVHHQLLEFTEIHAKW